MPDVKAHNPICRCNHPMSAHDFNSRWQHKRCTVATDKDGECRCVEFRFPQDKP